MAQRTHSPRAQGRGDIEFAPYRLTEDGELYCPDDRRIQLPQRLASVLFELAARNGAAVSRLELIERCWQSHEVGEDSLTRAIADLRKIFRAHGGDCIETVYGTGYRLNTGLSDQDEREKIAFCEEAGSRVSQRRQTTLRSAEQLYNEALAKDEDFLPALLGLAVAQIHSIQLGYTTTVESAPRAVELIDHVLDLDPKCVDALSWKGLLHGYACWDFAAAETLLRTAYALRPDAYMPNEATAWHKLAVGDFEGAERHFKAAILARPLSAMARAGSAFAHFFQGDADAALAVARELAHLDPLGAVSLGLAAIFEAASGTPATAVDMAERSFELLPESPTCGAILACALARAGGAKKARALLESRTTGGLAIGTHTLASLAWVELGEDDLAFKALESGFATRCTWLLPVLNDPRLEGLDTHALKAAIFKQSARAGL